MEFIGNEIMCHILVYVVDNLRDVQNLSNIVAYQLVCKKWYEILNSNYFNKLIFQPDDFDRNVWNKILSKYPKFPLDSFNNNLQLFTFKITAECELYNWNLQISTELKKNRGKHSRSIKDLQFSKNFSPTMLDEYLKEVQLIYNNTDAFCLWLDCLINLYDVPSCLEPVVWNDSSSLRGTTHGAYWFVITNVLIQGNTRSTVVQQFIIKHVEKIDWTHPKIFTLIDQAFVETYPFVLEIDIHKLLIHVQFTEDFLKETIIKKMHQQENRRINFSYMFRCQTLSDNFIEEIVIPSTDNYISNPTNWDLILQSHYVSGEFKEKYACKKSRFCKN